MGVLRAFQTLPFRPCTTPSATTYASPSPSPGVKIIPHLCPQKWQGNCLRFTVSVFQSVTDPDCTKGILKKLLFVSDCWKLSIQRKSKHNLALFRLFAFSVNIIHILGQQKARAISAKLRFSPISSTTWIPKNGSRKLRKNNLHAPA